MKNRRTSILVAIAASSLFAGVLTAQQIVSVSPSGAEYGMGGQFMAAESGTTLEAGSTLETNQSSVVLVMPDGARAEVAPGAVVNVTSTGLELVEGTITGTTPMGVELSVASDLGVTSAYGATFAVTMVRMGDGSSLEIKNVKGMVSFTADVNLGGDDGTVTVVEPGKTTSVAPGEKLIVRAIYDPQTDRLALAPQGQAAVQEPIAPDEAQAIAQSEQEMSAVEMTDPAEEPVTETTETAPEPIEDPVVIDIPIEDVETASNPGG